MKRLLFLILFFGYSLCFAQEDALKISFIDVGRGDAILIQSNNQCALVDTGTLLSGYQLLDYLQAHKITDIQHLIITHPHADHLSGIFFILPKLNVKYLYDNAGSIDIWDNAIQAWYEQVFRGKNNYRLLKEGDMLRMGEATLQVLWPAAGKQQGSGNHNSIVIKIRYKNFSCLLSADIDFAAEEQLLLKHADIKADVLKISHHGGREATNIGFLKAVKPKIAIICVDEKSKRGYPEKRVLNMLTAENIKTYRTDKSGTITISVNNDSRFIVSTEK